MSELTDAVELLNARKEAAVGMDADEDTPTIIGVIDQDTYRLVLSGLDIDVGEMYAISDDVARMFYLPAVQMGTPAMYGSSCYIEGFMTALMLMQARQS